MITRRGFFAAVAGAYAAIRIKPKAQPPAPVERTLRYGDTSGRVFEQMRFTKEVRVGEFIYAGERPIGLATNTARAGEPVWVQIRGTMNAAHIRFV